VLKQVFILSHLGSAESWTGTKPGKNATVTLLKKIRVCFPSAGFKVNKKKMALKN